MSTNYTPGLLALASGELARYAHSRTSIEGILRPAGSRRYSSTCLSVAENFNGAAQTLLDNADLQWMLLLNDDHLYEPTVLLKLLDRMEAGNLDAVTGLYFERAVPFGPVLFNRVEGEAIALHRRFLREDDGETITVDACGDGCMLVHRRVIEVLAARARETGRPMWELGDGNPEQSNHDMCFGAKLRALGFTITADLTVRVGHTMAMTIWPVRTAEGWQMDLRPRPDRPQGLRCAAPTGEERA